MEALDLNTALAFAVDKAVAELARGGLEMFVEATPGRRGGTYRITDGQTTVIYADSEWPEALLAEPGRLRRIFYERRAELMEQKVQSRKPERTGKEST